MQGTRDNAIKMSPGSVRYRAYWRTLSLSHRGSAMRSSNKMVSRDIGVRFALQVVMVGLCLCATAPTLHAEPQDRQVAEWVVLLGGSVRLEGRR